MKDISRRAFLKKIGLITGSAIVLPKISPFFTHAAKEKSFPQLVKVNGPSPVKNTEKAIKSLGGIERFVSKGDVVMIKPNIAWAREPAYAANTDPEVVATLARLCLLAGAKKVKVTDNTCNDARTSYRLSGIEKYAKDVGADVFFTEEYMFEEMDLKGKFVKKWAVNTEITEADVLINVPVAKVHSLARLTIGMKNWFGAVGGNRYALHQDIDQSIVDLANFFRPNLTVVDCTRILVAHGPTGGNLADVRKTDTVIASPDSVAAESCSAELFNIAGKDIAYIRMADEIGLGQMDLNKVSMETLSA